MNVRQAYPQLSFMQIISRETLAFPEDIVTWFSTLPKAFKSCWEPEGFISTFKTQGLLNSGQVRSSSRVTGRAGPCSCTQAKENNSFSCFVNSARKDTD